MPQFNFHTQYVDSEGVKGSELAETWATLEIRAGDSCVTRVLDHRAKTVRDFVHVPVYPLAEWLATNWWFLTYELENPTKEGDPEFHRRHSLSANSEGYAFPNLEVVPAGACTRISWTQDLSPWSKVEFLERGELWVDSGAFRETCIDFVDGVIRRLVSRGVDHTFLQEEWAAVQAADQEESRFCATAGALGRDPYSLDDPERDRILSLDDKLGSLLDEATPALESGKLDEGCSAIAGAIAKAKTNGIPLNRLGRLRSDLFPGVYPGKQPWQAGYGLAQELRRKLDLGGEPLPTNKEIADALDEKMELLNRATQPVDFSDGAPLVDGVVTFADGGIPGFAFRGHSEDGRRFRFCRALAEVLVSPGSDALLTRARSERQHRNRAFAAEFLAPSSALSDWISPRSVVDSDDIGELATKFGVSSYVIERQIVNHGIAKASQDFAPSRS